MGAGAPATVFALDSARWLFFLRQTSREFPRPRCQSSLVAWMQQGCHLLNFSHLTRARNCIAFAITRRCWRHTCYCLPRAVSRGRARWWTRPRGGPESRAAISLTDLACSSGLVPPGAFRGILYGMDRAEPERPAKRLTPFQRIVSAVARVPKSEVDALQAQEHDMPRIKRGPKPKPAT